MLPFQWNRHPSHAIVLSLLKDRSIYLPLYRDLIDYHMSQLFLHYLTICCQGSYFVRYVGGKWPKERFVCIRMLPLDRLTDRPSKQLAPHLVVFRHRSAVDILDAIPLRFLVGVTTTARASAFRPFMESGNTIVGCRDGRGHRARLPINGALSLWFYDRAALQGSSVDILTCSSKVFDVWTKTFRGLVSVNSSAVVQTVLQPAGDTIEAFEREVARRRREQQLVASRTRSPSRPRK
ncbi:hypothetical protein STCU_00224 [Strigomonas culicis]|uniref:PH-like domain-containing protein n=1 Tax=Strigomonas culicis TaxID=28005 RepID=S9V8F4_9TRYP|nr:hypothetical protein STCU_00224 [Strigomonas culicis]|eukprot:EPY37073.1 hypothetical protein STCU_00224 [Strigomonas culicis]